MHMLAGLLLVLVFLRLGLYSVDDHASKLLLEAQVFICLS